jgi:transposase InsO family protein
MEKLVPKDHGEEVAVFRSQVIGSVVHKVLSRGLLREALEALAVVKFRPPYSDKTQTYSVPTLERWYYAYRRGGLAALTPRPRSDRGHGRALDVSTIELVCDMRREHPSASAELILRCLAERGRLEKGVVGTSTLRRLFIEKGLDRVSLRKPDARARQRWEASHPGALWQGDVCHWGPFRIHGLLDDKSRYLVALEVHLNEEEVVILAMLVAVIRLVGAPDGLYLDNGSTYIGDALKTACARLGIALMHPQPHDPQARGKMERFWRTLRQGLLDHLDASISLADLQERLDKFRAHYNSSPHSSLFGDSPAIVWGSRRTKLVDDAQLQAAMTTQSRRLVSRDGVVNVDGQRYEVRQGFLAGHRVDVATCVVDGLRRVTTVTYDGKTYDLRPLDVAANGKGHRPQHNPPAPTPKKTVLDPFAPQKPDGSDGEPS